MSKDEKETLKISLSKVFLIIVIIAIIIMGCYIYIIYKNKKMLNNEVKDLENKVSNLENKISQIDNSNNIEIQENEDLSGSDKLVKQLYKYILKSDDFEYSFAWSTSLEPSSFYKDTKITYSSLSNMEKMLIILKNYDISEIKTVNKSELSDIINTTDIHEMVTVYENINEKSMQIFNQSSSEFGNYTGCSAYLKYINDNYYLSVFDGGGKGTSERGYAEIQKTEKNEDYIYIYDKYIYVDSNNFDCNTDDSKIHIYTSSDKKVEIGTEDKFMENKDLYNKYESKLNIYKHTFKKSESDSYYWVSTEIYE